MEINSVNNSVCFKARSPKIREVEKFCRMINAKFPMVSGTKIAEFNSVQNNPKASKLVEKLNQKIFELVRRPFNRIIDHSCDQVGIIALINILKEQKLGNCGEYAKLCAAICHMNGMEVIQPGLTLVTKDNRLTDKKIDHAVILIKPKDNIMLKKLKDLKDFLIIDPWLGFADFAPNIERKYKSEYAKFFKIPEDCDIALTTWAPQRVKYNEDTISELRKLFPDLIIKKGEKLIKNNQ